MKPYAICLECDRKKGSSLTGAWGGFVLWLVLILAAIAAATALLGWLTSR